MILIRANCAMPILAFLMKNYITTLPRFEPDANCAQCVVWSQHMTRHILFSLANLLGSRSAEGRIFCGFDNI